MAINAQGSMGKVRAFSDFIGVEKLAALTAGSENIGDFRLIGQGIAEADSGAVSVEADGLNGVIQLTTTDETEHSCGLTTAKCFDIGLMGTLVAETRVRFTDLDTKEFYFGLTDVNDDTAILEGGNLTGATATLTYTASDLCGFFLSADLTDDEDWHMVYVGGTTTGLTASGSLDADDDAVAGEWQILRLEVDNDGTARWYIDGVLKQTVSGAVSTTTDLAVLTMVETKGSAIETADIDYILVEANRDWTA